MIPISIEEMAGLSQLIVVDANLDGLIPAIKSISKKTNVKNVQSITNQTNPSDEEIHDALLELETQLIVFITKNCKHFMTRQFKDKANYYLVCVTNDFPFMDDLAKAVVYALRHDSDLKKRRLSGRFTMAYLSQDYIKTLKTETSSHKKKK